MVLAEEPTGQSSIEPSRPSSQPPPILQFTTSVLPNLWQGEATNSQPESEANSDNTDAENCIAGSAPPPAPLTTALPDIALTQQVGGPPIEETTTTLTPTCEGSNPASASPPGAPREAMRERHHQSPACETSSSSVTLQTSRPLPEKAFASQVGAPTLLPPPEAPPSENGLSSNDIHGPAGSINVAKTSLLPNRPPQDVARDTKRILEICYGSGGSATDTGDVQDGNADHQTMGEATADDSNNDGMASTKKTKTTKRKKKKSQDGSSSSLGNEDGETEGINQGEEGTTTVKKKTSKKKGTIKSASADGTEATNDDGAAVPKKKKKKKNGVKKEVLPRDAAGRIIRKRRKIKGRHKSVRKQFIKKGKDVKMALPTITEDDFGDEYDDSGDEGEDDEERDEEGRLIETLGSDDVDHHDDDGEHDDDDDVSDEEDGDEETVDDDDYEYEYDDDENGERNDDADEHPKDGCPETEVEPSEDVGNSEQKDLGMVNVPLGNDADCIAKTTNNEDSRVVDVESQSSTEYVSRDVETVKPLEQSFGSSDCTSSDQEDSSDESKPVFLANNKKKICAGLFLFSAVAGLVILIMYLTSAIGKDKSRSTAPASVGNGTDPSTPLQPPPTSLPSPVATPSPTSFDISTTAPSSTGVNETLPPTNPCQIPGVQILQAESAQHILGNATVANATRGYCQDGYVEGFVTSGSRVTFTNVQIETTGWYTVRMRFANGAKRNLPVTLQVDGENVADFSCSSTGNWSNWTVDKLEDVLLHEGLSRVVVWTNENRSDGPLVDWIGLEYQTSVSRFEQLTALLEPSIQIAAPSHTQVSALLWLSSDDPMDWSTMTDREIIERFVLVEFYYSTEGTLWSNNNEWLSEFHVCTWFGVACSPDNLVTDLMLDNNGLFGSIPDDLFLLSQLMTLTLDTNSLEGTITTEIGKFKHLSTLFLRANFLTGTIPRAIGNLTNLERLALAANSLEGEIPTNLYSLTKLLVLSLASNPFSGTLSPRVEGLKLLQDLNMQSNQLSGEVPTQLGSLTDLRSLLLGFNALSGTIPSELGLLTQLTLLDLNSNQLTGTVPEELLLLNTTVIDYYGNSISE